MMASDQGGFGMAGMITDVEDYFQKGCGRCDRFGTTDCSAHLWSSGQAALREVCRSTNLIETVKWGHPCYRYGDQNIALISAFRDNFRLTFMNAALLKDPEGILQKQGPNTRTPSMILFTHKDQVAQMRGTLIAYLDEAIGYAAAGIRPPRLPISIDLPDELVDALDEDGELGEAFHLLTPGRQRSYVIALSSAKTSATRHARIARFKDKIFAGKGAQER
jgi:uncharacterized protein YdeI (YjbR/CyaY-like superfamily)